MEFSKKHVLRHSLAYEIVQPIKNSPSHISGPLTFWDGPHSFCGVCLSQGCSLPLHILGTLIDSPWGRGQSPWCGGGKLEEGGHRAATLRAWTWGWDRPMGWLTPLSQDMFLWKLQLVLLYFIPSSCLKNSHSAGKWLKLKNCYVPRSQSKSLTFYQLSGF